MDDSTMKKLLAAALLLFAFGSVANAQCNGQSPNNTVCGNISGGPSTPYPITTGGVQLASVANTGALMSLATGAAPLGIWRLATGYSHNAAPPLFFTARNSACSLLARVTASISGRTMTVSAVRSGSINLNSLVVGSGITNPTRVIGFVSGTFGGAGTYTVDVSQNVSSESMTITGDVGSQVPSADGKCWLAVPPSKGYEAAQFGTIADGAWNSSTGAVSGTDNYAPLQAAINAGILNSRESVCIADGTYYYYDTLQVGYGASGRAFMGLKFSSCNEGRFNFYLAAQGVALLPGRTDRCAINVQGGRDASVSGFTIIGQNYTYARSVGSTAPMATTASAWLNPSLVPSGSSPGGLQQHSPYAALCLDAYAGSAPSDAYPTVNYPSWTGASAQYNKAFSSNTLFKSIECLGFAVCYVNQPNADGNGDFTDISDFECDNTVYCIAIVNSQARLTRIQHLVGVYNFAYITTGHFGAERGFLGGFMDTWSASSSYEFVEIENCGISTPLTFSHIYGEGIVRFGVLTGCIATSSSVNLEAVQLSNYDYSVTGVSPAAMIEVGAYTTITCDDCTFGPIGRIGVLAHGNSVYATSNLRINGGAFVGAETSATVSGTAAVQRAINYTGSMFLGSATALPGSQYQAKVSWGNPSNAVYFSTPTSFGTQLMGPDAWFPSGASGRGQISQSVTGFTDQSTHKHWQFAAPPPVPILNLQSGGGNVSVVPAISSNPCDLLTFTYYNRVQAVPADILTVGDILYDIESGTLWVITSIGPQDASNNWPVQAQQQNNMNMSTSSPYACRQNNINLSDTNVFKSVELIRTGLTVPAQVQYGNFISGSTNVINVGNAGAGSKVSTMINVGDTYWGYFPVQDSHLQWPITAGYSNSAASVTNGTSGAYGSMTLSAAAGQSGRFPILPLPVTGGPQ
jgi:hypothetical protein